MLLLPPVVRLPNPPELPILEPLDPIFDEDEGPEFELGADDDEGPEFELGADDDDDDDDDVHDPEPPPDAEGLEAPEDEEPGPLLPWFCCC